MAQTVPNPPPGFDQLPVTEQIEYVQSLWDRIAASPDQVPTPDWHLGIIRQRLQESERAPESGKPWEEVRAEVERKLGHRSSD